MITSRKNKLYEILIIFLIFLSIFFISSANAAPQQNLNSDSTVIQSEKNKSIELKNEYSVLSAPFLAADTDSIDSVIVYPNPYIPSGNDKHGRIYSAGDIHSGIIFSGINFGTKIEIYTLRGQLVRAYTNNNENKTEWQWDVKNKNGVDVASGWYLYTVNKNGAKLTGKLSVIR